MRFYLLVTLVLIAGIVNAQPVVVSGAGYDGRRWILTGGNALLSFDGESFLSFNVEGIEGIWDIAHDENLGWIIAAYAHDAGVRPRTRLLKLEGEELVDLGEIDIDIVDAIEGNGRYWLISGLGEKNARLIKFSENGEINIGLNLSYLRQPSYLEALAWAPWDNTWLIGGATLGKGWLVSYDEEQFTDLSREAELGGLFVRTIGCNEKECLIFAFGKERRKLLRYSPEGFSDLTSNLKIDDFVTGLTWTGSYWVLSTPSGYVIYDGGRFVNLTPPPETYSSKEEFIHALRNISGIHCVAALAWNGSEWLLSSLFPGGRVIEYNGSAFNEAVELSHVEHIAWGDGYWLLVSGGFYSRLVKYDGERLEDVTPEENISISAIAWNGSEWLIAGAEFGEPDYEGRRRIEETFALRYNGSAFAKVVIPGNAYISSIAWTGRRWLLAGSALLSYDGSELEEIPLPEGVSYAKAQAGGRHAQRETYPPLAVYPPIHAHNRRCIFQESNDAVLHTRFVNLFW